MGTVNRHSLFTHTFSGGLPPSPRLGKFKLILMDKGTLFHQHPFLAINMYNYVDFTQTERKGRKSESCGYVCCVQVNEEEQQE